MNKIYSILLVFGFLIIGCSDKSNKRIAVLEEKVGRLEHKFNYSIILKMGDEGATRGNLSVLRTVVALYYGDKGAKFPKTIAELVPEYLLKEVPFDEITVSNKVVTEFDGTGGWYYVTQRGSDQGEVYLNLNGKDSRGKPYRDY